MHVKRVAAALGLVTLAACGTSDPYGSGSGCTPTAIQVCSVGGVAFSPVTRTVASGTTITWINGDGVTHSVTNDPGSGETFNLSLGSGGTVTHQFNKPGTYNYHCSFHGSPGAGMHGTITVN